MSRIYKKFSLSWILTIGALIFTMMMVSACEKGGGGDTTETQGPIITEGPVTTQTPAATPSVPTVDLKLVRLDGTALEFAATPIPLSASIKATFSEAMDTKSVEGAASLLDSNSKSVAGTFSWSTDNTAMTFLPAVKLAPKSTFAFKISADALSAAAVPIAAVEQNFLAMTIGDVTGDGAIDFAVGAPGYKNKAGAVMLYSAKLDANNKISDQPITTIVGEGQGSFFGYAILIPGDLDEDGFADIVIGAPGHKNLDGAAYFFSGRNFSAQKMPLPTEVLAKDADAIITGELDWGYFGTSIGYLGDIDGDGFAEIIIGEPQMAKKVGTPKAYVFSGKKIATTKQMTTKDMLSTLTGDNNSGGLGTAIARAGDVNGDGQDEIMISAPGTLTATGQYVYIFKTNDFKNNVNVS
ncbi:MAG: Ig-like domain-containing protein, partial [bacterium]